LLPKPSSCKGCPLYGDGKGFVPDRLVEGAEVLVLSQNPGDNEERGQRIVGYDWAGKRRVPIEEPCDPQPLIGATGFELERDYLSVARLSRENTSYANVLKCRWQRDGKRTNDLPQGKLLAEAVDHCTREHLRIPESTKLIVAQGVHANEFLGCPGTVHDWRGFTYEVEDGRLPDGVEVQPAPGQEREG
jgi:uracil-DNA glycosylase